MENLMPSFLGKGCYFCGRSDDYLCYACLNSMKICESGVCIYCQKPAVQGLTHALCYTSNEGLLPSQLCSVYEYTGMSAQIIKKSKYNPKVFVLLKRLSAEAAKLAIKVGFDFRDHIVVPVPISVQREKERGFNQAEIIGKELCREFGLVMNNSIISRIRDTGKQFGLHKEERSRNIKNAFSIKVNSSGKNGVRGGKFLLVDDVCTTGSTLVELSRILLEAGANDVRCFTLTRKM